MSPNISAVIGNNKLYLHTEEGSLGTDFVVTIPDGLYGVVELAARIQREIIELGLPANLLVFTADDSTQKIVISFTYESTWIDFSQPDSCRDVLGFDSRLVPLVSQAANHSETGDVTASFDRINNYLLKSDIISDGISVNAISDSIIADILITSSPGSQIVFAPFHPPKANADELIAHSKTNLDFRLVDQLGRQVDTLGEDYSFTIVLRYVIKV